MKKQLDTEFLEKYMYQQLFSYVDCEKWEKKIEVYDSNVIGYTTMWATPLFIWLG